jgi:SAM-dependent methyltransferase
MRHAAAVSTERMYADLAPWFGLLSPPEEYEDEADHLLALIHRLAPGARTLLELGAGAGSLASHLAPHLACTLTDRSPDMLAVSRARIPAARHEVADMRTLRLPGRFDVVLVHDAIGYLTTEADLAAALATVAHHLAPGGLALLIPDETAETHRAGTDHGGADAPDGRGARYLEWSHPLRPGATTADVDYVIVTREADGTTRTVHDRHVVGVFPEATWRRLIDAAGLRVVPAPIPDPLAGEHVLLVARRR